MTGTIGMPWIALVESNTTGTGRLFCARARDRGLRPVVITRDPDRYGYLATDGVDVIVADTTDTAVLTGACRRLAAGAGLAGVTSSSEFFAGVAAEVASEVGRPAPDAHAVTRCRDKAEQRAGLVRAGLAAPAHRVVRSGADAVQAAADIGSAVVVKPVTGSGSEGVRLCRTPVEAGDWAVELLVGSPGGAAGRLLVEACLTGPEYSVELFDGVPVAVLRKHLGPEPYFVEIGHDLPGSPVGSIIARQLTATAREALSALGLGWGAAHVELRLTPAGPVVVEVNPRLAGGMIPVMIQLAGGADLVDAVIARAAGQPAADPVPVRTPQCAAIRFVVPPAAGRVTGLAGPDAALAVPGVRSASLAVMVGTEVGISHSFRDRLGHVIATGPDVATAARAAEQGRDAMRLTITPSTRGSAPPTGP